MLEQIAARSSDGADELWNQIGAADENTPVNNEMSC